MVIDTSAIIAIFFQEPDATTFEECNEAAPRRLISVVTRVELSFVVEGRKRQAGRDALEELLRLIDADIVAVTARHAEAAIDAFRRFGKGNYRAGLNIGDYLSYALSRISLQPLLFKGNDFIYTDVDLVLNSGGFR